MGIMTDSAESLLREFRKNADRWGILPDDMIRTYNPAYTIDTLPNEATFLALYIQGCKRDEEDDIIGGVVKTITFRVALLRKIDAPELDELDEFLDLAEMLADDLAQFKKWESDDYTYRVSGITADETIQADALREANLAMYAIDLEAVHFNRY